MICITYERLSKKVKGRENINISCEHIISEYSDLVYRIALTHLKNRSDVEDVFQEVFVSLIKNIGKIQDETHVKHWLIRATINRCKNNNISFWRKNVDFPEEDFPKDCYTENFTDNDEQIELIRRELLFLPSKIRTVVFLFYYEGYSVVDISNIIKVPTGTVKSRLHTARTTLKSKLGGII